MKTWLFACCGVAALLLSGCRSDPNIVYLERELRLQEDELFRLQADFDDAERELCACKQENVSLRKRLAGGDEKSDLPAGITGPTANKSKSEGPDISPMRPPALDIEMPKEATPPGQVPESLRTPKSSSPQMKPEAAPPKPGAPRLLPGPAASNATSRTGSWSTSGRGAKIERITLARGLTGGYNADRVPGDEGITVLIEPRDKNNQIVNAPGPVSVVLLDEEMREQGDAARIAQWEFATHELAPFFRNSLMGQGFYLELRWPDEAPKHTNLHLFVRYETEDGRKLQVDRAIDVHLPGNDRWTTSTPKPNSDSQSGPTLLVAPDTPVESDVSAAAPRPPKTEKPQARRPTWSPNR
jgi:hypothetical protein